MWRTAVGLAILAIVNYLFASLNLDPSLQLVQGRYRHRGGRRRRVDPAACIGLTSAGPAIIAIDVRVNIGPGFSQTQRLR